MGSSPKTVHPRCGKSWGGYRAEHCSVCCTTFSGTTAGDKHRVGPGDARRCVSPAEAGLVYDEARDLWRLPGDSPFAEREEVA